MVARSPRLGFSCTNTLSWCRGHWDWARSAVSASRAPTAKEGMLTILLTIVINTYLLSSILLLFPSFSLFPCALLTILILVAISRPLGIFCRIKRASRPGIALSTSVTANLSSGSPVPVFSPPIALNNKQQAVSYLSLS